MDNHEINTFINKVKTTFSIELGPAKSDPRTKAWVDRFRKLELTFAEKMLTVYYQKAMNGSNKNPFTTFKTVTPDVVFEIYNEVVRLIGEPKSTACGICNEYGLVTVKKCFSVIDGIGDERLVWHDFAMRCMCTNGSNMAKNIVQLKKEEISDYETIRETPAVYAGCYIYNTVDGFHMSSGRQVPPEVMNEIRFKQFTPVDIANQKKDIRKQFICNKERRK